MTNLNLMVGDWVEIEKQRVKIDIVDLQLIVRGSIKHKPIPLSPEVMEKIEGMEKHTGDRYYINIDTISIIFTPPLILGEWQTFFVFQYNDYRFLKLPYFHQLQQLIRLFTGKEIEVKWEK